MKAALEILKDLIAIPSLNPMGKDCGSSSLFGEKAVNEYIADYFRKNSLDVFEQPTELPDRGNIGTLLYKGPEYKTVVFQCHTDTVDIDGDTALLVPREADGRVFGRGSCDDKGGLAAMMSAAVKAAENMDELRNNVIVMGVSDEEYTWRGSLALSTLEPSCKADFGIIGEPTDCRVVNGYKGVARWRIETTGRSVHSSAPRDGISAIYRMGRIIQLIEKYQDELEKILDPPLGNETVSVGTISGGSGVNVVPEKCVIEIDRRITRKMTPENARTALSDYLKTNGIDFDFSASDFFDAENAALIDESHPGIKAVCRACSGLGISDELCQVAYGSDAFRMNRYGIPTILFGPGSIKQAHCADEYLEISQLDIAENFYLELMKTDLRDFGSDIQSFFKR